MKTECPECGWSWWAEVQITDDGDYWVVWDHEYVVADPSLPDRPGIGSASWPRYATAIHICLGCGLVVT
ncbi:MAG: hypothetical protein GY835_23820 [bacterium]|nr:hypothetical protein [bacterium]